MNPILRFCFCIPLLGLASISTGAELEPIRFNQGELVEIAAIGVIAQPAIGESIYRVEADGKVRLNPAVGGITYNFRTGDPAVPMAGNHVEPAVSIYNLGADNKRTSSENKALNALAVIGNQATVLDGDAKGATGWVIGKHGGAEHVMVDFPAEVYAKLAIGNTIQVRTLGAGMELANVEGVKVMNSSPDLIKAFNKAGGGVTANGRLRLGVSHRVPARIMGSGLGQDQAFTGDYDIQLFDKEIVSEYHLNTLRFGDIVAIIDSDSSYGHIYLGGAVTIGVVSHGSSRSAGHGPGVTTLFTSTTGNIEVFIDPQANLAKLLNIRNDVKFKR